MSQVRNQSLEELHTRILQWGIIVDVFLPVVVFLLAVYLRDRYIHIQKMQSINLFFYILLAVSAGEVPTILVFKRNILKPISGDGGTVETPSYGNKSLMVFVLLTFACSFSPTIYGLIYYLLGGTWEHFALFVAISFLLFQLFKPKLEELENLTRTLHASEPV